MVSALPATVAQAPPTGLFVVAALLLAGAVAALVLRPLRRDGRGLALGIGAGLVAAAGLLYLLVGTPAALDPQARRAPETMDQAVAQLEAALAAQPTQAEGWRLLGRAYATQGRTADAARALARVARLLPEDPDALVEAAQASAFAREDRLLDAQAVAWLDQALAVAPGHQRARWFRGIAYRQAGDPAAAARTWAPLLEQVDPATAATLRGQVDAARAEAGLPPLPGAAVPAGADARRIAVAVDVAPALAPRLAGGALPEGAVLYVIARQAGGAPVPVAVERIAAATFPLEVVLDDSDGLMPTLRLSRAGDVVVEARISLSGDATPRPGDLASPPIAAGDGAPVAVTIDHVVE